MSACGVPGVRRRLLRTSKHKSLASLVYGKGSHPSETRNNLKSRKIQTNLECRFELKHRSSWFSHFNHVSSSINILVNIPAFFCEQILMGHVFLEVIGMGWSFTLTRPRCHCHLSVRCHPCTHTLTSRGAPPPCPSHKITRLHPPPQLRCYPCSSRLEVFLSAYFSYAFHVFFFQTFQTSCHFSCCHTFLYMLSLLWPFRPKGRSCTWYTVLFSTEPTLVMRMLDLENIYIWGQHLVKSEFQTKNTL